jgi:hypothetical protein
LFEQARRLAAGNGDEARAFISAVQAAQYWTLAGDDRHMLAILPELLDDIPDNVTSTAAPETPPDAALLG